MTLHRGEHGEALGRDVAALKQTLEDGITVTKGLARMSFDIPERRLRAAISELRLRGFPVVSWSEGDQAGYRRARDGYEVVRFVEMELESRALELLVRAKAMRDAIPEHFGPQQRLFDEGAREGGE